MPEVLIFPVRKSKHKILHGTENFKVRVKISRNSFRNMKQTKLKFFTLQRTIAKTISPQKTKTQVNMAAIKTTMNSVIPGHSNTLKGAWPAGLQHLERWVVKSLIQKRIRFWNHWKNYKIHTLKLSYTGMHIVL